MRSSALGIPKIRMTTGYSEDIFATMIRINSNSDFRIRLRYSDNSDTETTDDDFVGMPPSLDFDLSFFTGGGKEIKVSRHDGVLTGATMDPGTNEVIVEFSNYRLGCGVMMVRETLSLRAPQYSNHRQRVSGVLSTGIEIVRGNGSELEARRRYLTVTDSGGTYLSEDRNLRLTVTDLGADDIIITLTIKSNIING